MGLTTFAAAGRSPIVLWYVTRATGMVSLVLLTATVALGIVASVGATTPRWPRFASQALHRDLSLFCLVLVGVHVVSTVVDGYVPIGSLDAFLPFASPYRTLWVGMGAVACDLLLAVAVTSGLRRRIGLRSWRSVHWLAYLCWPIAMLHGLGVGTDTRKVPGAVLIELVCVAAVVLAGAWRLAAGLVAVRGRQGAGPVELGRGASGPAGLRTTTGQPDGRVRVSRSRTAARGIGGAPDRGANR